MNPGSPFVLAVTQGGDRERETELQFDRYMQSTRDTNSRMKFTYNACSQLIKEDDQRVCVCVCECVSVVPTLYSLSTRLPMFRVLVECGHTYNVRIYAESRYMIGPTIKYMLKDDQITYLTSAIACRGAAPGRLTAGRG